MQIKKYTSFLYLEDGSVYRGWSFFDTFRSVGEVVFNTGMTGYQEVMTDPEHNVQRYQYLHQLIYHQMQALHFYHF